VLNPKIDLPTGIDNLTPLEIGSSWFHAIRRDNCLRRHCCLILLKEQHETPLAGIVSGTMSEPDATSRPRLTALESLRRRVATRAAEDSRFKGVISRIAGVLGYDLRHLIRVVYQDECRQWIDALDPSSLDVLEISAGATWREVPFRSYRAMDFPQYDICRDTLPEQFDLIIADQVFEHLLWPYGPGATCSPC
jgi:hypothetical protein